MNAKICERIKKYRRMAGITQNQAASALNMNRTTYSRHEQQGNFAPEHIEVLAKLFGVPSDWIWHGESLQDTIRRRQNEFDAQFQTPMRLHDPGWIPQVSSVELTNGEQNIVRKYRRLLPLQRVEVERIILEYIAMNEENEKNEENGD